jgi:hypothetical protein
LSPDQTSIQGSQAKEDKTSDPDFLAPLGAINFGRVRSYPVHYTYDEGLTTLCGLRKEDLPTFSGSTYIEWDTYAYSEGYKPTYVCAKCQSRLKEERAIKQGYGTHPIFSDVETAALIGELMWRGVWIPSSPPVHKESLDRLTQKLKKAQIEFQQLEKLILSILKEIEMLSNDID